MALNDISNIEESLLNAYDVNYGDLPPEIAYYINMPGTNPNKVLEWFNLGLAEPQTFNQARLLAEAVGYSPEQAKVVAGQWQMESSGGSRLSSPYNYFGIKSHNEAVRNKLAERGIDVSAGKEAKTKEGKGKAIKSSFMEFKNAFEGFAAHKAFLESNQRYQKALAASTAKDFAVGLQKAGYATAENYGIRLYNDFVKPKELNPKSGDTRPKSFGETKSEKIKPFNLNANYKQETVEKLPLFAPPMLDAEGEVSLEPTMGQGMYGSTAYKQELEAETPIKMSAKPGSFGSGKLNFNNGGTMNFKSKEAYQKWLAYGHASGEFAKTRGNQPVSIKEKSHKVEHAYGGHMYAAGGSFNNPGFNALPVSVQNKIKANSFADGGQMGNPLTEFNAGGSHEENPLGGIPQGMAPDGRMNLVEQGETKLDAANYIFSDNLKVTKQIVEDFNLPKKLIGKTFAAASKTLDLPNSRRENDTIETNYKRKTLETLMNAQEVFKQEQMAADMAAMFEKYPEQMSAIMQQNAAPGGQMTEGAPQQMPEQGMPAPEPVPTSQLPMSYGGSMYMKGGRMCADGGALYNYGGNLYDFGGTMRSIGAGAYGVGEGMLDTLTFGLTDSLTDKGYNALSKVGKTRTAEELERDRMIRGFGNTAGAITGAVVSGGATTGSAISEGSEGLGEGLTNIKGTGEDFDKTVNALAQMGSMAGSFVGGNPTAAANSPEFVQTLMKAKENPLLNQGINMLDQGIGMAEIRKNGGPIYHQYNQLTDQWKNNAGPMGQGLTNTQMYAMGGNLQNSFLPTANNQMFTRKLVDGGPEYFIDENDNGIDDTLETATTASTTTTKEENYKVDPTLSSIDQDLTVRGTLPGTLANLAPIAYNLYQGLQKPKTYNASDFYTPVSAFMPDYTQAINDAKNTYAQTFAGLGQTGGSGGVRAANLANAALQRNQAMARIQMEAANQIAAENRRADAANAQLKTEAMKNALQTNWALKTAQQEHIKEGLTGTKDMFNTQTANDLAMKYATLGAPDIAKHIKTGYIPYGQYLKEKYFTNNKPD